MEEYYKSSDQLTSKLTRILANLLVKLSRTLVNLLVIYYKFTIRGIHSGEARTLGVSELDWLDYEPLPTVLGAY